MVANLTQVQKCTIHTLYCTISRMQIRIKVKIFSSYRTDFN